MAILAVHQSAGEETGIAINHLMDMLHEWPNNLSLGVFTEKVVDELLDIGVKHGQGNIFIDVLIFISHRLMQWHGMDSSEVPGYIEAYLSSKYPDEEWGIYTCDCGYCNWPALACTREFIGRFTEIHEIAFAYARSTVIAARVSVDGSDIKEVDERLQKRYKIDEMSPLEYRIFVAFLEDCVHGPVYEEVVCSFLDFTVIHPSVYRGSIMSN